MTQTLEQIMTTQVQSVTEHTSICDVARLMRDQQIGDVLVTDAAGKLYGIVTDRDLVVRALADEEIDVDATRVKEVCSQDIAVLHETDTVEDAVRLMAEHAVRRIPVVRDDVPIGIVTIGDLAKDRDPRSALAAISAAPPNN